MKNHFLALLLCALFPLFVHAQDTTGQVKFGYFSYEAVMKAMPAYASAQRNVNDLRAQYDAEAKRSENDFNAKYEAFLEEQGGLAENIRQKRQAEIMDLMEKNTAFKAGAERIIADAERKAKDSLTTTIDAAARAVGSELGLAFIINTDNHSLPFVNSQMGIDVTEAINEKLSGLQ
jgi:outer membrane protein